MREPALDGEDTTFRTRQLTQVRAVLQDPDARGLPPREPGLPGPTTDARLRTGIRTCRHSSWTRTGANNDFWLIPSGETVPVIAVNGTEPHYAPAPAQRKI